MRRVEVTAEDNHWMMEVSTNIFSTYSHSASSPEGPLEQDTGAMTWALSFRLINEFETDSTERKRRTSSGCWRKHRQTVAIWSTKYFHAVEWGFCNILLEVWWRRAFYQIAIRFLKGRCSSKGGFLSTHTNHSFDLLFKKLSCTVRRAISTPLFPL